MCGNWREHVDGFGVLFEDVLGWFLMFQGRVFSYVEGNQAASVESKVERR